MMNKKLKLNVLIVDDNEMDRMRFKIVCDKLQKNSDYELTIYEALSVTEAFDKYLTKRSDFSLILLDKDLEQPGDLPTENGLKAITEVYSTQPFCKIILITGNEQEADQALALRQKARFIVKSSSSELLLEEFNWAIKESEANRQTLYMRTKGSAGSLTSNIVPGNSTTIRRLNEKIKYVSKSPETVLLTGESGSGKTFIAKILHERSKIKGRLTTVDIGGIQDSLIDGELFGHEKGSFTGATSSRPGLLLAANGGTLFIDEIQNLSLDGQKKLLRVIETGKFRPIGSTRDLQVNIRFIFASNRNLLNLVDQKLFREDLYYRISVVSIDVPSLKDRVTDIPLLLETVFPDVKQRTRSNLEFSDIPDSWIQYQIDNPPKGNVRELINRFVQLLTYGFDESTKSKKINLNNWKSKILNDQDVQNSVVEVENTFLTNDEFDPLSRKFIGFHAAVDQFQKDILNRAISNSTRKVEAAEKLGIDKMQLYRLESKFDLKTITEHKKKPKTKDDETKVEATSANYH